MKWSKNLNFKKFELKKNFENFFFLVWTYVKPNLVLSQVPFTDGGGKGGPQKKVAQNELKHILVLEFLRSDDFLGVVWEWGGVQKVTSKQARQQASNQPDGHYGD